MEPLKIIIVDDDKDLLELITNQLNEIGISDIESTDRADVAYNLILKQIQTGRLFDLIISDLRMPKTNGIELLRKVRAHPILKKISFIIITGYSEKTDMTEALKLGVSDLLVRPYDLETLRAKIEKIRKISL